jgi:hypothetical protein
MLDTNAVQTIFCRNLAGVFFLVWLIAFERLKCRFYHVN